MTQLPAVKPSVALVLGSGGARGMAHIGVIEELLAQGYTISSIAGCSIGSLVGAAYACGCLSEIKNWICRLDEKDIYELFDWTYATQGLIGGEGILKKLAEFGMNRDIESLPIPYVAIAVDMKSREEVVFTKGPLLQAIRASIAIPTFFTPLMLEDMELVDGGITNPLPVNYITRTPADAMVAVSLNGAFKYTKPVLPEAAPDDQSPEPFDYQRTFIRFMKEWLSLMPSRKPLHKKDGVLELLDRCFDLMQDRLEHLMLEKHPPELFINLSRKAAKTFEFHRATELIEAGRIACTEALAETPLVKPLVQAPKSKKAPTWFIKMLGIK
jgi:NTE family protein